MNQRCIRPYYEDVLKIKINLRDIKRNELWNEINNQLQRQDSEFDMQQYIRLRNENEDIKMIKAIAWIYNLCEYIIKLTIQDKIVSSKPIIKQSQGKIQKITYKKYIDCLMKQLSISQQSIDKIRYNNERSQLYLNKINQLTSINLKMSRQIEQLKNELRKYEGQYKQKLTELLYKANDFMDETKEDINQRYESSTILQINSSEMQNKFRIELDCKNDKIEILQNRISELQSRIQQNNKQCIIKSQILEKFKRQLINYKSSTAQLKQIVQKYEQQLDYYKRNQRLIKENYLFTYFNQEINTLFQSQYKFTSKDNINNYFQPISRDLFSGNCLKKNTKIKIFLQQSLRNHEGKSVKSTQLLYKYHQLHKSFGNYISNIDQSYLVIFKLANGRICGGYCPSESCLNKSSFLYSYLGEGRVFNKKQGQNKRGSIYSNNTLCFGFNELVIMNNSARQFRVNTQSFGAKYFTIKKQRDLIEEIQGNIYKFVQMQIHIINF